MTAQRQERIPAWTRGDRLRKARLTTGQTAREFAENIGVSHGTVSNAEGDKHEVRKIVLNAWSLATGVPVEWLEHGDDVEPDADPDESIRGTHWYSHLAPVLTLGRAA